MSDENDDDHLKEYGQLFCDGALVCERAEGQCDEDRQQRNDNLGNQGQNDFLEFVQNAGDLSGFGAGCCKTDHNGKDQSAHNGHDRRNFKLKYNRRKLLKSLYAGDNGKMRDQRIARCHGKQCGAQRRGVGDQDGNAQHAGSIISKLGDGGRDKADDDQRYTEIDDLPKYVLQGDHNVEDCHGKAAGVCGIENKTENNTKNHAYQELKRKARKKLFFFI